MANKRTYYVSRGGACSVARVPYRASDGKYYDENYCLTHHHWLLDCLECGREFHTDRPHTKWCSAKCRQKNYRKRKAS